MAEKSQSRISFRDPLHARKSLKIEETQSQNLASKKTKANRIHQHRAELVSVLHVWRSVGDRVRVFLFWCGVR